MGTRQKVYEKSQGKCWYCGIDLPKRWHTDHFKPLGRNPDGTCENPEHDHFDNLVPACPPCNIMKSSMNVEKFRWLINNFVTRLNRDITIYKHAKRYGLVKETDKKVEFWYEREGLR